MTTESDHPVVNSKMFSSSETSPEKFVSQCSFLHLCFAFSLPFVILILVELRMITRLILLATTPCEIAIYACQAPWGVCVVSGRGLYSTVLTGLNVA